MTRTLPAQHEPQTEEHIRSISSFVRIAAMHEHARRVALCDVICAELNEDDTQARLLMVERLQAWAIIARSAWDAALRLGRAHDAVILVLPTALAARQASLARP